MLQVSHLTSTERVSRNCRQEGRKKLARIMDSDVSGLFFIDTKSKASPKNLDDPADETESFQIVTTASKPEEATNSRSHATKKEKNILGVDDEEEELEQLVFGAKAERLIEEEEEEEEELGSKIQFSKADDVERLPDEFHTLEVSDSHNVLSATFLFANSYIHRFLSTNVF